MSTATLFDRWFLRRCPPHALAVFRIAFGAFLLLYWGLQLPSVALRYSAQGLLLPEFAPTTYATLIFTPPPPWVAYVLVLSFLLALLCFTLGLATRVSGTISFLLYAYYWTMSLYIFGTSYDRLFLFILLVLIPSGCDRAFSLAMLCKRKSLWAWEPISILPQRLLSLQIAATYLGVGWEKLTLDAWQGGGVLQQSLTGRWATPLAYAVARLRLPMWMYDWMVNTVKGFEILMPFGVWWRRSRWWFFAGGALFHIAIALFLGIWWFLVLIPAYIVFFEPEEVYGWLKARSRGRIL